jgi:hypothetical protein
MMESSYWFDEAFKYRERALISEDPDEQRELLELAQVCAEFAVGIEERATGG